MYGRAPHRKALRAGSLCVTSIAQTFVGWVGGLAMNSDLGLSYGFTRFANHNPALGLAASPLPSRVRPPNAFLGRLYVFAMPANS